MDDLRQRLEFYRDLGIKELRMKQFSSAALPRIATIPVEKPVAAAAAPVVPSPVMAPKVTLPSVLPALAPEGDTLATIRADMGECTRCRLHIARKKIVYGSGNESARLVFVGEGPGADEDASGLPFVGRAGQLLTQMINGTASKEGLSITREDVYICNVVKCRPPENRTPEPDEMQTCGQFLFRQLSAIKPKAICALGSTAAKALLGGKIPLGLPGSLYIFWVGVPSVLVSSSVLVSIPIRIESGLGLHR